ncbi:MAG: thioredoxin family protein [Edaphocola sp.]
MRKALPIILLLFMQTSTFAQQVKDAISWRYATKKINDSTFDVQLSGTMKPGWHIYTATPLGDGSQIPTTIRFDKNPALKLIGKTTNNGKAITEEIKELDFSIQYYKGKVTYTQRVQAKQNTTLAGTIDFQICNEEKCLPTTPEHFKIKIDGVKTTAAPTPGDTLPTANAPGNMASPYDDTGKVAAADADSTRKDSSLMTESKSAASPTEDGKKDGSLWGIFLAGLGAGFAAFITPCIYAMLPITVSFFTKRSKNRATGIRNAIIYSLSIIGIFALIGVLISIFFKENTMYLVSTSIWFNLFVFVVFVVFGISLLGAFEITLPAAWSTKLDTKANTNSFGGIFFMALVLVVVSFSCTSAFLSWLIVQVVQAHNRIGGFVGFLGFGSAIALPFAIFALFPGLLNNIAKSGGWLNSVKVCMGFIELAMSMKFLSNVDLQYHWHLLDYEVYLSIWIVLALLLGLYLLGAIRFSHDDGLPKNMFGHPYLSVPRLFFAIASLSFMVYMIPGLWGAPLNGISGWLPERKTLDFNLQEKPGAAPAAGANVTDGGPQPTKYTENLKSEFPGVKTFFDYGEALAASKKTGKPVLLDFTGHSCVNCRKMEAAVLKKPEVLKVLAEDFIIASLYCDDKSPLAEADVYANKNGDKIDNLGDKNVDIEVGKYGEVGQPIYIFVDADGKVLKNAGGYVPDVPRFLNIMKEAKGNYEE